MLRLRSILRKAAAVLSVLGMTLVNVAPAAASSSSTIDFEGLLEGQVVSSVSYGAGISGANAGGSVAVYGMNPVLPGLNAAVIFDATCLPGGTPADCTGDDADLFQPTLGNILIVDESLGDRLPPPGIVDFPDDTDVPGAMMTFDFSGWGPGVVSVNHITVLDVESEESGGTIQVYAGGVLQGTVGIPVTGNGGKLSVPVGLTGDFLKVTLQGSGAIDNIELSTEEGGGGQGCTPGFWKNHTDVWTTYTPGQRVDSVFTVPGSLASLADDSLLDALNYPGGKGVEGGARIMLRAAVAGLLNASSPGVNYPLTTGEVITQVNAALSSLNRATMISLGEVLDGLNNLHNTSFCN